MPASHWDRIKTLALVALLSICIAPVSWRHAYTLALPILFVLWHEAFQRLPSKAWLAALIFFTLAFGFVIDSLIAKVTHGVAFGAVPMIVPITSLVIIFVELARIHRAGGNSNAAA
jgi:hypothetical protein